MAKLDNSILESSDKDVHPSKESNKGSETEPTNISEVTEKSAHQVPQFNCDQCIFQGASCKEVKHHTRMRQKIHHLDGKSDCNVDETQSAKTLCPDDSKAEYFMEENKFKV